MAYETRNQPRKDYKAMNEGGSPMYSSGADMSSQTSNLDSDDDTITEAVLEASVQDDTDLLHKSANDRDAEVRGLRDELEKAKTRRYVRDREREIAALREELSRLGDDDSSRVKHTSRRDRSRTKKAPVVREATDPVLVALKKDLSFTMRSAFASGSLRNLHTQWKAYFLFCEVFNFQSLPTDTNIVCLFIQFLSRSMRSTDSIRNYVSGVKTLHLLSDIPFVVRQYEVSLALRGIARLHPHLPLRAAPMTPLILLDIYRVLDMESPAHTSFWCLFLFAFFLLVRKSNLVSDSVRSFDPRKQLLRRDILADENLLLVVLKWSKTNQFGRKLVRSPLISIPGSPLCPVQAFHNMCSLNPSKADRAAFQLSENGKSRPITYPVFHSFLRKVLAEAGHDPAPFSSHSFRRGGATWAFSCQVPGETIQALGDWSSDAYKCYLEFSLEDKLSVCRHIRDSIVIVQACN
ncbi:uncharacterized protein LOC110460989 [Mizuhopecten yessoensis]|uniref:uncharacterized protein LOC110448766 n=1 Tax=Mizuhopecten yessoensis TaxID=6573 RepID=UPI000B45A4B4|nr:uncharacterized protein LOC110448766 [Mizuhopecten yessoensis]XP_021359416.1 uncharacterized protein LOC110454300 [Mizuhopecten yessoensis]XP_021369922.1 uncharacterized protein LOC110460989 [Mizuhopecten yessoensis]